MSSAYKNSTLVFLLSSIGLIVLPHIYNLPPVIFGFFCFLLIWRFIGVFKPNRLPTKSVIFLLTVCGMALLYFQHQGLLGRDAGTSLFVTALALKLLEMKTERDHHHPAASGERPETDPSFAICAFYFFPFSIPPFLIVIHHQSRRSSYHMEIIP